MYNVDHYELNDCLSKNTCAANLSVDITTVRHTRQRNTKKSKTSGLFVSSCANTSKTSPKHSQEKKPNWGMIPSLSCGLNLRPQSQTDHGLLLTDQFPSIPYWLMYYAVLHTGFYFLHLFWYCSEYCAQKQGHLFIRKHSKFPRFTWFSFSIIIWKYFHAVHFT